MAAAEERYLNTYPGMDGPYSGAAAVTPHDTNELAVLSSALYIGVAGDLTVVMADSGMAVLFKACPVGVLRIRARIVKSTGTAATNILNLY